MENETIFTLLSSSAATGSLPVRTALFAIALLAMTGCGASDAGPSGEPCPSGEGEDMPHTGSGSPMDAPALSETGYHPECEPTFPQVVDDTVSTHPGVRVRGSFQEADLKTINFVPVPDPEDPHVDFFATYTGYFEETSPTCVLGAALAFGREDEAAFGSAAIGGGGHLAAGASASKYCGSPGEIFVVHGRVPTLTPTELEFSSERFEIDILTQGLAEASGDRLRPQIAAVEAVEAADGFRIRGTVTAPARSQRVKVTIYPKNDSGLVYDALETIVEDNGVLEAGQAYPFVIEGLGCDFAGYETAVEWVLAD